MYYPEQAQLGLPVGVLNGVVYTYMQVKEFSVKSSLGLVLLGEGYC